MPPKGVRPNFTNAATVEQARIDGTDVLMQHVLVTDYRYNSLNQVVAQHTPDANNSQFWYDRLGRLVVSQNAKQYAGSKYSYTLYDLLGRINEVGELTSSNAITENTSKSGDLLGTWMDAAQSSKTQITKTTYDFAYFDGDNFISLVPYITQENLRNRVSWTALYNTYADLIQSDHAGQATATFYTYDVHGNVGTLLQDYKQGIMATSAGGNRYKKIVYDYDLISGKVNKVSYQPGEKDAFYHRYSYDAENRITEVYTSSDDIYWDERDAHYQYYKHGPLSRTELGKLGVQGIDYTYTLQGWLKSINQSAVDLSGINGTCAAGTGPDILTVNDRPAVNAPAEYKAGTSIFFEEGFQNGIDDYFDAVVDPNTPACVNNTATTDYGTAGAETIPVARDAYNVILSYYDNDYTGIGAVSPSYGMAGKLGGDYHALFNGNISSMAVNVGKLGNPLVYAYQYDQLNRLVNMNAYKSSNESWGTLTTINDFKEAVFYDPNGNILNYNRNGNNSFAGKPLAMDNLGYSYIPNTNKLDHISDNPANTANYTEDIDDQQTGSYDYDKIGNLTKDLAANINTDGIEWTVYGKISKITKNEADNTVITYTYDASGNRISKTVTKNSTTVTTWYVRDAGGNTMAVYTAGDNNLNNGSLTESEVHLYGSSRLGLWKPGINMTTLLANTIPLAEGNTAYTYNFTRGNKFFELSNHLGNVLATVNDKKLQHTADNTAVDYYLPDVVSAGDYAPFGMQMPRRTFSSGNYRYGFNGQEHSNDVTKGNSTAEYWEYDSRIGKRWNIDPVVKDDESPYMTFGGNPIVMVDPDGADWIKRKGGTYTWTDKKGKTGGFWTERNKAGISTWYGLTKDDIQMDGGMSSVSVTVKRKSTLADRSFGILSSTRWTKADVARWDDQRWKVWQRLNAKQSPTQEGDDPELIANAEGYQLQWQANKDWRAANYLVLDVATMFVPIPKLGMGRWLFGSKVGRALWTGAGTEAKAISEGFLTFGQTNAGKIMKAVTSKMPYYPGSLSYKLWGGLSKFWVKSASGPVHVFQLPIQAVENPSIFKVFEFDALKANKNVTDILFIY